MTDLVGLERHLNGRNRPVLYLRTRRGRTVGHQDGVSERGDRATELDRFARGIEALNRGQALDRVGRSPARGNGVRMKTVHLGEKCGRQTDGCSLSLVGADSAQCLGNPPAHDLADAVGHLGWIDRIDRIDRLDCRPEPIRSQRVGGRAEQLIDRFLMVTKRSRRLDYDRGTGPETAAFSAPASAERKDLGMIGYFRGLLEAGRTSAVSRTQTAFRLLLGAALLFAGLSHLSWSRSEFLAQVPDWFPADADLVVVLSGLVEVLIGAALLVAAKHRVLVGFVAAAFFVAIFPGNIAQLVKGTDAFGLDFDTARAVRLPFQPVLVGWALWSAGSWRTLARHRQNE